VLVLVLLPRGDTEVESDEVDVDRAAFCELCEIRNKKLTFREYLRAFEIVSLPFKIDILWIFYMFITYFSTKTEIFLRFSNISVLKYIGILL
jgi:hypothetical protein